MLQQIAFMASNQRFIPFEHEDKFYFRKDKKWHWVQKLCFKILRKIGAYAWGQEEKIDVITFEPDKVIDYLSDQLNASWRYYGFEEIDFVLMGPKQFAEIMRIATPNMRQQFGFEVEMRVGMESDGYRHQEIMGMKIRVVPTVDGIVVIPKQRGF